MFRTNTVTYIFTSLPYVYLNGQYIMKELPDLNLRAIVRACGISPHAHRGQDKYKLPAYPIFFSV